MPPIRVLLVDNKPIFRDIATDFLNQHKELNVVGTVGSSYQALLQVKKLQPQLILLDLSLSGLQIIPKLREILPEINIIVLTIFDGEIYQKAALAAGADDYLPKAALTTDLLATIQRVMGSNVSHPNTVSERIEATLGLQSITV